jgi:hypothetical protein
MKRQCGKLSLESRIILKGNASKGGISLLRIGFNWLMDLIVAAGERNFMSR